MKQLTKQEILNLNLPERTNMFCIGEKNGKVVFRGNKDLLITKRKGKYAERYGEFALLSVLNTNFAEFSDHSLESTGRLGDDVWTLTIFWT